MTAEASARNCGHRLVTQRAGASLPATIALLAIAATAGTLAYRLAQPEPATSWQFHDGIPLNQWAAKAVDSAAANAGLSFTVKPVIRPLDERSLGDLRRADGYRTFLHRCATCHDPPDPMMHGPQDWPYVVHRMGQWMQRAGALPLPPAESAAIVPFLQQAVRTRQQRSR